MELLVGDTLNISGEEYIICEFVDHDNLYKSVRALKLNTDEKYLLVLVTCHYGAGWSSWNPKRLKHRLLTDSKLIYDVAHREIQLENDDKNIGSNIRVNETYYNNLLGITDDNDTDTTKESIYYEGLKSCKVAAIKEGTFFIIEEYDGLEKIIVFDEKKWFHA
jgi:hypothetical protein